MKTLVVKIPEALDAELTRQARLRRVTKSALVRERLEQPAQMASLWDRMKDLVITDDDLPCDLSTNKKHMEDYGKSRAAR